MILPLILGSTVGQKCAVDIPTTISATAYPPHFIHKHTIINAIAYVESRHNPCAVNVEENAIGLLQIRQVRIDDYNQRTGKSYHLLDMHDRDKAIEVFDYYAMKIGYHNVERIARCWNGGANGMNKISTYNYYLRVVSAMSVQS